MKFYTILYQVSKPETRLKINTYHGYSFTPNTHPNLYYYKRHKLPIKVVKTTSISNEIIRNIPSHSKAKLYKEGVDLLNYVYIQYFTMRREQLPQEEKDRILKALTKRIFYGTEIEKDFLGAILTQLPYSLYPEINNLAIYCRFR